MKKEILIYIREYKEFDSIRQDKHKFDIARQIRIKGLIKENILVLDTPRDSTRHMARHAAPAARQTTSRCCASQCRGSSKARGYG